MGVSPGVAQGTAYVLACAERAAAPQRRIDPAQVDGELVRFESALAKAESDLLTLKQEVGEKIGASEAEIFAAQALVVRDPSFRKQVALIVSDKQVNVEAAVAEVMEKFTHAFEKIPDAYLRERAADIRDVSRRILSALIEEPGGAHAEVPEGAIIVSEELLPSATANLELNRARGFVTERGGKFSHASILARSLGTPAVAGIAEASLRIKTGDQVIVDGVSGVVFVNPEPSVQEEYQRLEGEIRAYKADLRALVDVDSRTADGIPIALMANVSKFADTEAAVLYNAGGIGLYRTEFSYSIRPTFPTEDEQYEFLNRAAERLHPRKVVFRLLDLGGDKELPYFPLPSSRNPSLAQRGIRLLLRHPAVLRPQLRAFLRVSADHPVAILLPVVAGVEEVREARRLIGEIQAELAGEGKRFNAAVPVGAMIEVPAAALMGAALAREIDFFSLGTNDLVQYVLAADREDESTSPYYQPLHPAVLRLIRILVEAADAAGKPVTICGEMAGMPEYTELLIGLGLRELSVAPGELLDVKSAIRQVRLDAARSLADRALTLSSAAEVEALLARPREPDYG
jgi:phosphotransferase system enzyme I (PtsI)